VDTASKEVEEPCELLPFECDQVLNGSTLEDLELITVRTQLKEVDARIDAVMRFFLCKLVNLFNLMLSDIGQDIQGVLDLVDLFIDCIVVALFLKAQEFVLWEDCSVVLSEHKYTIIVGSEIFVCVSVGGWPLIKVKLVVENV
jgi:hypothetical protein